MEEPEIHQLESPERETLGEGSADLERLLQKAEAENLELVKLIETERQKSATYQKQIEDTVSQTEKLEELTKNLDVEAKQLHNKFKQNREICESFRKAATVLDEHEEALRKKLEAVTLQQQTQKLQQQKDLEKYEKIWETYFKKYESMPLAVELSEIKQTAINTEMNIKETIDQITKIQSQIIEIEVEKTHMQEYLQENPETTSDCIIKMARLFLDVEKSTRKTRQKLSLLKNVHQEFSLAVNVEVQAPENEVVLQNTSNAMLVQGDPTEVNNEPEKQGNNKLQLVGSRIPLTENQAWNVQQSQCNTADMVMAGSGNQISQVPRKSLTYISMPLHQQHQGTEIDGTTKHQPESEPTAGNSNSNPSLPEVSTQLIPSSHQQEKDTECHPEGASDPGSHHKDPAVPNSSQTPTTPKSGCIPPASSSESATPVCQSFTQSPLDLNKHINFIKQATRSPGEGFTYQSRSMYNIHQVPEPGEETDLENEPEVIYEAPLNDQPDISLNFFQPFTQQSDNARQNVFQANTQPSPDKNRNTFLYSSPSKSAPASPQQSFSFGFGATSPSGGNFMLSNPSGGIFGGQKNQADDSFTSGFSFFGTSNSSDNNDNDASGGFSFSFGAKSPSKPGDNSGFCLF